jgi:hypothetical protein
MSAVDQPITLQELRDSFAVAVNADESVGEPICMTAWWAQKFVPMMLDKLDEIAVQMIVAERMKT